MTLSSSRSWRRPWAKGGRLMVVDLEVPDLTALSRRASEGLAWQSCQLTAPSTSSSRAVASRA